MSVPSGSIEHVYEDGRARLLVGEPPVGADQIATVLARLSGVDLAYTLASLPVPVEVDAFSLVELTAGWQRVARFAGRTGARS